MQSARYKRKIIVDSVSRNFTGKIHVGNLRVNLHVYTCTYMYTVSYEYMHTVYMYVLCTYMYNISYEYMHTVVLCTYMYM